MGKSFCLRKIGIVEEPQGLIPIYSELTDKNRLETLLKLYYCL